MPETPYTFLLRMLRKRFPPVLETPDLMVLSLSELLSLLYSIHGTFGCLGDYNATWSALSKMVGGSEVMYQKPPENQTSTMVQ